MKENNWKLCYKWTVSVMLTLSLFENKNYYYYYYRDEVFKAAPLTLKKSWEILFLAKDNISIIYAQLCDGWTDTDCHSLSSCRS